MKRFFFIAAAALLAITALSSCKKDGKEREFGYAIVTAEYRINDALSKVADVTLDITKMDGTKTSMPVSTTAQVVDIDKYSKTLPAAFSFAFSANTTSADDQSSYQFELVYKFTIKVFDTEGKLVKSDVASDTFKYSIKPGQLEDFLTFFNKANNGKLEVSADMSILK